MKHASLFSGIGGFDLAAQNVGFENVFHCEINPFCQTILKYYWPNAKTYTDIKQTDFSIWRGQIDILTGGFPCQPFSSAGQRKGTEDERHLWPQMLRAIREIKPRFIVGENVSGFLTWNGFIWSRAEQNIPDTGQYDLEEPIFSGKSASCMIRKYVFNKVRGFDKDFEILGEESDLAWRVWLSGYYVIYCPKSLAYHKFNTPLKPFKKFYNSKRVNYNGSRNYQTMLIKNLGKQHIWIVPIHMSIWFFVGIIMVLTGKIEIGTNILKGIGYIFKNWSKIMPTRISRGYLNRCIYRNGSSSMLHVSDDILPSKYHTHQLPSIVGLTFSFS